MYGRLHQRKLKQEDYIMSCEKARRQLDHYIDQEAKRVNIDSAKKRAVLQHMDYDGFRQMVLGANIFPTKTTELQKFTKGENAQTVANKLFIEAESTEQLKGENKKSLGESVIRQVQGKSQMLCNSFREFKKKINQNYPKNSELTPDQAEILYALIKNQDQQRISKIFNMQCEANILVKVIDVFEFIVQYLRENDNEGKMVREVIFQVKFLQTVLKLKSMREFSLSILSKKQRSRIIDFLQKEKQVITFVPSNQSRTQQNLESNIAEQKQNIQNEQKPLQKTISQDEKIIDELIQMLAKK